MFLFLRVCRFGFRLPALPYLPSIFCYRFEHLCQGEAVRLCRLLYHIGPRMLSRNYPKFNLFEVLMQPAAEIVLGSLHFGFNLRESDNPTVKHPDKV
jgi:hypothetical protein